MTVSASCLITHTRLKAGNAWAHRSEPLSVTRDGLLVTPCYQSAEKVQSNSGLLSGDTAVALWISHRAWMLSSMKIGTGSILVYKHRVSSLPLVTQDGILEA